MRGRIIAIAAACVAVAAIGATYALAEGGSSNTLNACAKKDGQLRLVQADAACRAEHTLGKHITGKLMSFVEFVTQERQGGSNLVADFHKFHGRRSEDRGQRTGDRGQSAEGQADGF